ncbi:MAG: Mth938-like domain-containing protein [Candidatus Contendobacter sp.]|nr:Mth938-like domain-containing protein [Candidatus Contendobacter sp.]MDG4558989.1 Mth938-like domain-containing protein [Candidatus Contendobacter sp.]
MRFSLDSDLNRYSITGYGPDWVRVNQQEFRRSVIVTPERLVSDWPPRTFGDLVEAHFAAIADLEPEIVLLGTGGRQRFPRPSLTRPLLERGVGVEIMDTAAACRTYNIVMLEGRRVAAALLLLTD